MYLVSEVGAVGGAVAAGDSRRSVAHEDWDRAVRSVSVVDGQVIQRQCACGQRTLDDDGSVVVAPCVVDRCVGYLRSARRARPELDANTNLQAIEGWVEWSE